MDKKLCTLWTLVSYRKGLDYGSSSYLLNKTRHLTRQGSNERKMQQNSRLGRIKTVSFTQTLEMLYSVLIFKTCIALPALPFLPGCHLLMQTTHYILSLPSLWSIFFSPLGLSPNPMNNDDKNLSCKDLHICWPESTPEIEVYWSPIISELLGLSSSVPYQSWLILRTISLPTRFPHLDF